MSGATRVLVLAGVLGLASCSEPMAPVDVTGTYTLRSIDGQALPVAVAEDDAWREVILAGSIALRADESCSVSRKWRVEPVGSGPAVEYRFTVPCTYTIDNSTLVMTFTDEPDTEEPATISDGFITQIVAGAAWVFEK